MKGTSTSRVMRAFAGYGNAVPRWEVQTLIHSLVSCNGKSVAIVTRGIDRAKNDFVVHGVDEAGRPVLVRPSVPRAKLLRFIASLAPCGATHPRLTNEAPASDSVLGPAACMSA